jgi:predicted transposase YdaD
MPQQPYDKSSKWMLQEQGRSILFLAGARSVLSCTALQAEVVQPRSLPDGLLEVTFAQQKKPSLFLVEVATYPEKRIVRQVAADMMLVRQARGVLPETLVLVLRQRGQYQVPTEWNETSVRGWSKGSLGWKVVELWKLSAEELLGAPDVGVVPWTVLAQHEGPPRRLLQRCRERIDREGGALRDNLLAVTQIFARLRYDRPEWLEILGGRKAVLEFPLIRELQEEARQEGLKEGQVLAHREALRRLLLLRFKTIPDELEKRLRDVTKPEAMQRLFDLAFECKDLAGMEEALHQELTPQPASTPAKRRSRKPST